MTDNGAYRDEMKSDGRPDRLDRLVSGDPVEGDQELTAFAEHLRSELSAAPDPATESRHLARIVAAASPAKSGTARPRTRLLRLGLRLGLATAALMAATVGLAVAGVDLPDPAVDAFRRIGVALPNQPEQSSKVAPVAPVASDRRSSDDVKSVIETVPPNERGCDFGKAVSESAGSQGPNDDSCPTPGSPAAGGGGSTPRKDPDREDDPAASDRSDGRGKGKPETPGEQDPARKGAEKLDAKLDGLSVSPGPGDANGSGKAKIKIVADDQICFSLNWKKIAAPSSAHIHRGDPGQQGPAVITLFSEPPKGNSTRGCVEGLDPDLVKDLGDNPDSFYVQIHTPDHPAGALRGQLSTSSGEAKSQGQQSDRVHPRDD